MTSPHDALKAADAEWVAGYLAATGRKTISVGGGVSGGGVQLVPYDLAGQAPAKCPKCNATLRDGQCPIHGTAVAKEQKVDQPDLLKVIEAELARRGYAVAEKLDAQHGWEYVKEGKRTRKGKRPDGSPGIAGVERDGRRYGVGVGRDNAGVFVYTHRLRSRSYPHMDAIPTKALQEVDASGAAAPDLFKYSEDQPRDDHGRWAAGGGESGNPKRWGADWAPHDSVDTMHAFYKDGQWDPARVAAVWQPEINRMLSGVTPADGKPTVYMTGGGYGSGKSTLLDKFPEVAGFPNDPTAAARVDPDAIKQGIPEYQYEASPEHLDPGAATFVHEESSAIAKTAVADGLEKNLNIIYDTSGDTGPDKLAEKVAGFREAGAGRVVAAYAFPGSIEEAQARADARAEHSGGLRRYVDPAILSANHREVAQVWLASAKNGVFDNLSLWSTAGKFGDPPSLIASAQGGKITVSDQQMFDKFRQIGGEG